MHVLEKLFRKAGAFETGIIKFSDCEVINQRLIERLSFSPKSVIIGYVPYYTHHCDSKRTVSSYALPYDYHKFLSSIGEKVCAEAINAFPSSSFAFFADHSPINEKLAAARAGLGIIGENTLLITPNHSSYVFIFELFTDIEINTYPREIIKCENCGACKKSCPGMLSNSGECLSAVTQKKGELTAKEEELIRKYRTVWGCDICQEVCPHTVKAKECGSIYSNIPEFNKEILTCPTQATVNNDADFKNRAYSWRGTSTILRNIKIIQKAENTDQ